MQIAMKKKFVMAVIAVLMGVGCYLGYRSTTRTNAGESDLLLANAEALADASEPDYSMTRILDIKYTGGYHMTLYCTTCSFWYGYVANGSASRCKNS